MKRKILGTFLSRIIVAGSSLVVLVITSRSLGPEARGTISLLLIAMTITLLTSQVVAGPALVYFFPRTPHRRLFRYAAAWALLCSLAIPPSLQLFDLLPVQYTTWVIVITILQSFSGIAMMYQLAAESAKGYNLLAVLQASVNPVLLFILFYFFGIKTIGSWLNAVAGAQLIALITGIILILRSKHETKSNAHVSFRQLMEFGFLAQLSTLTYILSTRISYYLLDTTEDRASVGIFSTGISVMEAALLFSSSVALMTYSRISNSQDEEYNIRLTTLLAKTTFLISAPLMLLILIVPESVYLLILGGGFYGVKSVMYFLIPGIMIISMSTIFTHYFSGKGLYRVNVISSVTGLFFSIISAFTLIPYLGMKGAAITSTIGYFASGLYTIIYFCHKNQFSFRSLLPGTSDIKRLLTEIKPPKV